MLNTNIIAETAALVGDPARASMLAALMDGRALTAAELARIAGITPQTASGHLARLTEAGLLALERQGRHHYHRLASATVAQMLEGIMATAALLRGEGRAPVVSPRDKALRHARTCYDHLAGELAVAIADRMVERGHVEFCDDGGLLTSDGAAFLRKLGLELDPAKMFCRPCLDWSERRLHIAGSVGRAFCHVCFAQGWIRRIDGSRAVSVTPSGRLALRKAFGPGVLA
jgi:DNA-binding transcriptional ArsR family regulator